jgi:carbon-monoxide dehydrogenase medium subunit
VKPAAFSYHAPVELEEALAILGEHGYGARVLAGGQSLVPLLALRMARFAHLVDVNRVDGLAGTSVRDGALVLGATTRQSVIARDELVLRHAPLLAEATGLIGHFQIRNRGTIGGSLAHADPAAEYPAIALALDAELEVAGTAGRRTVAAGDLISSPYVTTLAPEEVIVAIRVPIAAPASGFAVEEVARRRGDFALAGAAAAITMAPGGGGVGHARVVTFGVGERPLRLEGVERSLLESPADAGALEEAIVAAVAALDPPSDVQATGAYRRAVARPLVDAVVRRALAAARRSSEGRS